MRVTFAVPLVVFTAVLGCTRTNAALLDNSVKLAPSCADGVKIYSTPSAVGGEYKEVALLNSTANTGLTSEAGMLKSMRKIAVGLDWLY